MRRKKLEEESKVIEEVKLEDKKDENVVEKRRLRINTELKIRTLTIE